MVTVAFIIIKEVGFDQALEAVGGSTVLDPDSDPDSGASGKTYRKRQEEEEERGEG